MLDNFASNHELLSKAHCVYRLCYHVVLVTKFRRQALHHNILSYLIGWLPVYARSIKVLIREINGGPDHIHLLLELTPQDCVGHVIGATKARSSKDLHERFDFPMYWGRHSRTLWSEGYFVVSAGGAPLSIIQQYIQNQSKIG